MNWLDLARIGEECPHATESSFTVAVRAKWERVAAHVTRSPLSASGTAEMRSTTEPLYIASPGDTIGMGESVADTIDEQGEVAKGGHNAPSADLDSAASPSLPPWPKCWSIPPNCTFAYDRVYDMREAESWRDAALARIAALEESLRIHVKLYTDSHSVEFEQRDQIASLERKLDLAHEAVRGRNDLAEAAQALGELWDGLMAGRQHSYVVRAAIEKIKALEAENARLTSRLSRTEELWLKHTGEMVPIMESREDAWSENERIKAENARLRGDLEQSILDGKGTAKLLAIAERDRNRAEAIAAALRDGDCHDACEAPDKCERCGKPATHDTADWVPLCKACYDALSVDPSPAAQDRRETNEQNTAQRDAGERGTPRPQEDGITAITTPSGTVPLSQPDSPAPQSQRETDTNKSEGAAIREDAGRAETDTTPRTATPSDASPAAWTEEQLLATRDVVALVWHGSTSLDPYDDDAPELDHEMTKHGDRYCAEIAKHASKFVKPRRITREELEKAVRSAWRVSWPTLDYDHAYVPNTWKEEPRNMVSAALSALGIEVEDA